jgi:hypothetical protein
MRRPGTIVTLSSLATAVVGVAVSSGAARLTSMTAEPSPRSALSKADSTGEQLLAVRPSAERARLDTPAVVTPIEPVRARVVSPLPTTEIVFASSDVRESAPVSSASMVQAPLKAGSPARRVGPSVGVSSESGVVVTGDHAPRVGEVR